MGERYAGKGLYASKRSAGDGLCLSTLHLHRVEAACIPGNERSIRVLEKAGFQREGLLRSYLRINGIWQDHHLFALIAGDPQWLNREGLGFDRQSPPSDASIRRCIPHDAGCRLVGIRRRRHQVSQATPMRSIFRARSKFRAASGNNFQVTTAPSQDGIVRRIEVEVERQAARRILGRVRACANTTDEQIDRLIVAPHFRLVGSGLIWPDLGSSAHYRDHAQRRICTGPSG